MRAKEQEIAAKIQEVKQDMKEMVRIEMEGVLIREWQDKEAIGKEEIRDIVEDFAKRIA